MSKDNVKVISIKSLLLGAVAGGVAMFLWVMVSWMAIPWHMNTINAFENDQAVAQVLIENAPTHGIYTVPDPTNYELTVKKPFGFVSVVPEGVPMNMGFHMGVELLTTIIACGLLTMLCLLISGPGTGVGYWCKVKFVTMIGVIVAIASYVPDWNWWHFPLDFTLVGMADSIIATFIAGLVIAAITPSDEQCNTVSFS